MILYTIYTIFSCAMCLVLLFKTGETYMWDSRRVPEKTMIALGAWLLINGLCLLGVIMGWPIYIFNG